MPRHSRILPMLFALLPMQVWAQSGVVVELRKDAVLGHGRIVLSDVASVHADEKTFRELGAVPLGRAPRIGYRERMTRQQIEQAIARHGAVVEAVQWQGAAAVVVSTRAQVVPQQVLTQAAIGAVKTQFVTNGATLVIQPATPVGDIEVPLGRLDVKPRAVPVVVQGGSAPVWIDLFVDDELYRTVVVRLEVSLRRPAYLARRDIAPGAQAGPDDFDIREHDVVGAEVIPADQPFKAFRAARAIRADQPLTTGAMHPSGTVLRGDLVRVSIQAGPISIETAATAMADAVPGQALKVRPAGSDNLIAGRVSRSGTVIIE